MERRRSHIGRGAWLLAGLLWGLAGCQGAPAAKPAPEAAAPAAAAAAPTAPAPTAAPAPIAVVFSIPGRQLFQLSPLLAQDQGLFREEGLDATVIEMETRQALSGLITGEVGYDGRMGSNLFLAARTGEVRAAMFLHALAPWRLMGQPDVRDVAALRGARVTASNPGSAGYLLTRAALRRAGLDPERDVELSYTGLETARLAALETGQVRAATLAVPFDAMMAGRGYPILADAMEMKLDLPITGVTATPGRLASRPDEARRVLRAILRAQQFIRERRDDAVDFAARTFELDRALVASELDRLVGTFAPEGELSAAQLRRFFELNEAEGVDLEVRLQDVRFEELFDYTALRAARRELGQ
ncbi:MAG TPA: ABC transporter substrate-binding protein [Chloroflexota bacterium]|nr:ABC transporter substrate-binding protein [Chloroflexota bacterium]